MRIEYNVITQTPLCFIVITQFSLRINTLLVISVWFDMVLWCLDILKVGTLFNTVHVQEYRNFRVIWSDSLYNFFLKVTMTKDHLLCYFLRTPCHITWGPCVLLNHYK